MGSESERAVEPSLLRNRPTRIIGLPKRDRIGAGRRPTDQCSLPLNPVESTALKPRKTSIRNEVTASGSSSRSMAKQASAASQRIGKIA